MSRSMLTDGRPLRGDRTRAQRMLRNDRRLQRIETRLHLPTGARMKSTICPKSPPLPRITVAGESSGGPHPAKRWRLLATLAHWACNGSDHDEAASFRIEHGNEHYPLRFTTARDEHVRSELLGPPPLGL